MNKFTVRNIGKYCLLALLCGSATAYAAEAGRVIFVTGNVVIGGHAVALNGAVSEGDELVTGGDGYVYVETVDHGLLILRPNSRARVITYSVDVVHPANTHVKLELTKGVARSISGQAVKQARQNFRFNTPVAAIGVRGTDFIVYTDDVKSRVNVASGGIVMSGFEGGCRVDGTGPCEGAGSRELFAGQAGALLQIERGKNVPQLLHNPALLPDQNEKPRSDEPAGKVAPLASPVADVDLDAQRSDRSLESVRVTVASHATSDAPAPPVVTSPPVLEVVPEVPAQPSVPVTPPVTTPPVASVPARQEIFWGRWQAVAGYPARPGNIEDSGMATPSFAGMYAITRVKDTALVMPSEGTASFKLANGEALMQKNGGAYRLATIESGNLDVNFVDRTFATGLAVKADSDVANLAGRGVITDKGVMLSDPSSSMAVRGYLGGPNAEQAGYVFKGTSVSGIDVAGATSWTR